MNVEDKAEKLAIILTKETYADNVKWEEMPAPSGLTDGTSDIFPLYLGATYKNTDIGLFQRRYKHYLDEIEFCWSEEIGMCVTGDRETVLWEHKARSSALINLFEAAREQASGIEDILDDLLK